MLLLALEAGDARYAIPCRHVVEVTPLVLIRPLPAAPAFVAGLFEYRGEAIPAIDLTVLLGQRPSADYMSTRIIVVDFPLGAGTSHKLGLVAERVTDTISRRADEFQPCGVHIEDAPYLGGVTSDDGQLLQVIELERLLPRATKESLFSAAEREA
jgi:chemotaxis-related protein WspB